MSRPPLLRTLCAVTWPAAAAITAGVHALARYADPGCGWSHAAAVFTATAAVATALTIAIVRYWDDGQP